ncbi:MAG: hypothetical protein R3F48_04645 [Candidatus Zixiibacteriota bacterium]
MSRNLLMLLLPTTLLVLLVLTPHIMSADKPINKVAIDPENQPTLINLEQGNAASLADTIVLFELGWCYGRTPLAVNSANPDTTYVFAIPNFTDLPISYSISVVYTDGDGWASANPSSGILLPHESVDDTLLFEMPSGATEPSTWQCMFILTISPEDPVYTMPVCLTVGTIEQPAEATIATACKRLAINNFGGSGLGVADATLDFIDDCDTFETFTDPNIYLYMGTPIIARLEGTDTLVFQGYTKDWLADNGFRPIGEMTVDSISTPGQTIATSEFVTADTSIGCILTYYAKSHPDSCEGVVQHFQFTNLRSTSLGNVYLGSFFDWDVPSDTNMRNTSGFISSDNIIYQQGYEYDNVTNGDCGQYEDDRFAGVKVIEEAMNMMTIDLATWVYDTGPYGADAPFPAGPTYQLMRGFEGYLIYNSPHPDSVAVDLGTLITYGGYFLSPGETIDIWQVIGTGKTGLPDLIASLNSLVPDSLQDCCVLAGDTNGDGVVNIGDCVFNINHIFKGGPRPPCMNAADWNHDCGLNIGDAVYCISHIFKGGPAPQCGCID